MARRGRNASGCIRDAASSRPRECQRRTASASLQPAGAIAPAIALCPGRPRPEWAMPRSQVSRPCAALRSHVQGRRVGRNRAPPRTTVSQEPSPSLMVIATGDAPPGRRPFNIEASAGF
eukprot:scaffold8848_cov101-Isochrysis_galbana.AAC.3